MEWAASSGSQGTSWASLRFTVTTPHHPTYCFVDNISSTQRDLLQDIRGGIEVLVAPAKGSERGRQFIDNSKRKRSFSEGLKRVD